MNDVTFNQPTLALLGAAWLVLSGVIWTLFQLVKGRMERAENQVDKGLGSLEKLADSVDLSGKGIVTLASEMAAMKAQHELMQAAISRLEHRLGAS